MINYKNANNLSNKSTIINSIYLYWVLLMVWQTFRVISNRSTMDILVKVFLIIFLACSVLRVNLPTSKKNILLFFIFGSYMIFVFFIKESSFTIASAIAHCFPVLFSYLFLVHLYDYRVTKDIYKKFLNLVIFAVCIMVVYCFIFSFDKFIYAFNIRSAYGNELTSFFFNNHEYALYLLFGSQACMFCYQFCTEAKDRKSIIYIIMLIAFISNLILTYSRTAILGLAVLIIAFFLSGIKSQLRKYVIFGFIFFAITIFFIPHMQKFIVQIVLKENTDAGRFEMWNYGIRVFENSSFFKQLTGQGYINITNSLEAYSQHSSFHNAYIQVLLQYGVIGLLFFIGIIVSTILNSCKVLGKNRFIGSMFLSMTLSAIAFMFTNTTLIFQSNIDSYMMTMFILVLPVYVKNAIVNGCFYE